MSLAGLASLLLAIEHGEEMKIIHLSKAFEESEKDEEVKDAIRMTLPPVPGGWKNFLVRHCDNEFAWEPWLHKWLIPYLIGVSAISFTLSSLPTAGQATLSLLWGVILVIYTWCSTKGLNFLFWRKFEAKNGSLKLIQNLMTLGFKFDDPGETILLRGNQKYDVKEALEQMVKLRGEVMSGEKEYYSGSTLERINDRLATIIRQETDKQTKLLDEGRLDRLQSDLARLYSPVQPKKESRYIDLWND